MKVGDFNLHSVVRVWRAIFCKRQRPAVVCDYGKGGRERLDEFGMTVCIGEGAVYDDQGWTSSCGCICEGRAV